VQPGTARQHSVEQVPNKVRSIIVELAPEGDEPENDDARLVEDLRYHSLALMELAFALEDEYDLAPIDEHTARRIRTVHDVVQHVMNELRAKGRLDA
jgi:acyl carrier protein